MEQKGLILKGDICYSLSKDCIATKENAYLVSVDGIVKGVFEELPEAYQNFPLEDFTGKLIVPGLVDLHIHAPQYPFRGIGMDLELLDWLDCHAFLEEAKYQDPEYAKEAYGIFAEAMKRGATTRVCMFGTLHVPATLTLMDAMEETGLISYVGKVNMDRNSPDSLRERDGEASMVATKEWLSETEGRYQRTHPILTPRFIPSCTNELMEGLKEIQSAYGLPVQSHLSENFGEIQWVKELCPEAEFYGDAYDRFGLFGKEVPTIMAHCVHSTEEEIRRMKENRVFVAHCPQSNMNLSSGAAPVRQYLEEGLLVGLGSDVAGGVHTSIFRAMAEAIQVSKLRWRMKDDQQKALTVEEAFFMGTKGGGAFFGKVGSFEPGFEMDAVVLEESFHRVPGKHSLRERLERMIYLAEDRDVLEKYVKGKKIKKS
jgi:guanine deaminase